MLHGRVGEQTRIDELLEQAREGRGGALVLRGEPGIGKTALLEFAAEQATGMRVLRTAGVEPEQDMDHAALHRAVQPVLDTISGLPPVQAEALDAVFGRSRAPVADRFLVALSTLTLLTDAARTRPLLCLVDDGQWVDQPSLDVLAFTARRLAAEPVAVLFATRPEARAAAVLAGLPELPLAGLDRTSARLVLRERGIAADDEDLLLRTAAGNPLALEELPVRVPSAGPRDEPLPLVERLQEAFLARLPPAADARRLLLLAAADGTGRRDVLQRALPSAAELDGLHDLIHVDGPTVTFRHPLVRSAVYHAASPAQRRAAHRALATALEPEPAEHDRRAWHLGQAADGPDEVVAAELEHSAERAMRRGGAAAAADALTRAAQLTPPGPDQARRLVAAASASWHGGDAAGAVERLDLAERVDLRGPPAHVDAILLRALIELRTGNPADALRLLRPALAHALSGSPDTAIELLMLLGDAGYHAGDATAWREVSEAVERLTFTGDDPPVVLLRLTRAVARVRSGAPSRLTAEDLATVEQLTEPGRLCWAGGMLYGLGDRARGRWLRRRAMERARAVGAVGTLAWVLEYVVLDEMGAGRYRAAEAYADEGNRYAAETGQSTLSCWYRSTLAVLAAVQGRDSDSRELAESVLAATAGRQLLAATTQARRALGLLDLTSGRFEQAVGHLRPPEGPDGAAHPGLVLQNVPELVEAAQHLGRPELAAESLRCFTDWADASGSPELLALVARCRALIGEGDVEGAFRRAVALHPPTDGPLELARTQLLYGEHLRRARRRSDARPLLRAALETFEIIGATTWARRARDELRATGETTTNATDDALAALTPQELRIATAAGNGASNREIAAQLFLSTRTIDYHLRKVFQKLGISSRVELTRFQLVGGGKDATDGAADRADRYGTETSEID
jgi:DNA-binding CsgD family transcriptional regulator